MFLYNNMAGCEVSLLLFNAEHKIAFFLVYSHLRILINRKLYIRNWLKLLIYQFV